MDIGGYRTDRLLGRGGSARVWAATAPDGSRVALKLFDGPQERKLVAARREVALAAQIDHPHVVIPRSVICDADRVAVIAPLAAGGSLAELLERRASLTPAETLTVLIPLAAVLATAHERGVVHGDLSAANVVIDGDGRPLVTDLGAAKVSLECGLPVQATPSTAAPEVARGGVPDAAADVFSWGAVALQCLTGRPAWNALDLQDVVVQATVGQWPDPGDEDGPAPLVALIRAALGDVPARRPGAASIAVELRRCGEPAPLDLERAVSGPSPATRQDAASESGDGTAGSMSRRRIQQLTRVRADAAPDPDAGRSGSRPGRSGYGRSRHGRSQHGRSGDGRLIGAGDQGREQLRSRVRRGVLVLAAVAVVGLAVLGGLLWAGADAGQAGAAPPAPTGSPRPSPQIVTPSAADRFPHQAADQTVDPPMASSDRAGGRAPQSSDPHWTPESSDPHRTPESVPTAGAPTSAATPAQGTAAPPTRPSATAARASSAVNWLQVVRELDSGRADALVRRDPDGLATVYTAGAAGRTADAATIERLTAQGLRVTGASHRITGATAHRDGDTLLVTVTDSLPAYRVLDDDGRIVGATTARRSATRVLEIVEVRKAYRIAAVRSG